MKFLRIATLLAAAACAAMWAAGVFGPAPAPSVRPASPVSVRTQPLGLPTQTIAPPPAVSAIVALARTAAPSPASTDSVLEDAFARRRSNVQAEGSGIVSRVLADDNDGSRHQRFILELASGRTLLVAHNIELAPRIEGLRAGDTVDFFGEYEWNAQGGVIHWTHRDPGGRHVAGWLRRNGRMHQ